MKDELTEISHHELAHVNGGFLALLGLLGTGGGIAGQILGAIGKKKSQKAEQIMKDAGGGEQQAGAGNMMGERAPTQGSGDGG